MGQDRRRHGHGRDHRLRPGEEKNGFSPEIRRERERNKLLGSERASERESDQPLAFSSPASPTSPNCFSFKKKQKNSQQSELGDVVYVELPEVGAEVSAGETYGVVESVKAASDVYSPVSGEVVEVNDALVDDPSKVNTDSFGSGWMMKVKLADKAGAGAGLMDSKAYKAHVDASAH